MNAGARQPGRRGGRKGNGASPRPSTSTGGVTEVSLVIGGMTCSACAARIQYRLNKLPGVEATVNFASGRARALVASDVPVSRLVGEVEATGYIAQALDELEPLFGRDGALGDDGQHARDLGRRLVVAALLFMPICDFSLVFWMIPVARFPGWQWVLVVLGAPVVTWAAWPFYSAAVRGARHGTYTMDTLVSLGVLSATGYSVYSMFFLGAASTQRSLLFLLSHRVSGATYIDVAAGVTTFVLAGRYFEASTRRRSGSALRSLAALGAKEVTVIDDDGLESRRPVSDLVVDSQFVVRPGEAVASDGEVVSGNCEIDRSAMTGEPVPVEVGPGDLVVGGTVVTGGRLIVRATRVGKDTQLAHMIRLVDEAQTEKADVQRLADRVSGVFVPAVIVASLLTLGGWIAAGGSRQQAVNAALSVLIIACPCALGLATPTALVVASGEGARRGIFFKGYQGIEASRLVNTVVLDKTGTVTTGHMDVTDVETVPGVGRDELLRQAGAVEQASEHLVARAIFLSARDELGQLPPVEHFVARPGLGTRGTVEGHTISVGRPELSNGELSRVPAGLATRCAAFEALGRTTVVVWRDDEAIGAIAVADTIRPSAPAAVRGLQSLGLDCVLLTGDNVPAADAVGCAVGVGDVIAGASPAEKVAVVRGLQAAGRSVAMVGDGVNDGPTLAAANLGVAIGSGTDVAINAADIIVVRDDLAAVPTAISLARRTIAIIRGNLVWAFAYNLAALPLAACGLLNPVIAAAAMAFSSAFVVWNSARLRHFSPPEPVGHAQAKTGVHHSRLDPQPEKSLT